MADVDIINEVWKRLTDDADYLALHSLPSNATPQQKAGRMQKEQEPNNLATTNIPLTCIYPIPGLPDKNNDLVYEANVQLDIYASSLFQAMTIGKKARELLHDTDLPVGFRMYFVSSASSEARVQGIKKYIMRFEISEVI